MLFNPEEVLNFWFKEIPQKMWYKKDSEFDKKIINRFGSFYEQAIKGNLDSWIDKPNSALALIIILDQFSRNMFRGSLKAFEFDHKALSISKELIKNSKDKEIQISSRYFAYMPLMHSEDLDDQILSVKKLNSLLIEKGGKGENKFAKDHKDIIEKYGRFPHRNKTLNRKSTPGEEEFLKEHGGY